MQFFAVAALLFTAAFAAPSTEAPAGLARRAEAWCPPGLLYSNPLCCDADVLGVADVDCVTREYPLDIIHPLCLSATNKVKTAPEAPSKCKSFGSVCASIGRQPKCCAIPVVSPLSKPSSVAANIANLSFLGWFGSSLHRCHPTVLAHSSPPPESRVNIGTALYIELSVRDVLIIMCRLWINNGYGNGGSGWGNKRINGFTSIYTFLTSHQWI